MSALSFLKRTLLVALVCSFLLAGAACNHHGSGSFTSPTPLLSPDDCTDPLSGCDNPDDPADDEQTDGPETPDHDNTDDETPEV